MRARRALAQERLTALQARATPLPLAELMSGIRTRLQRTFTDVVRGLEDRFATCVSAPTAPLWATLDTDLAAVEALEQEARVKATALKLSAADEERWLQRLRTTLLQHGIADIAAVRDMLKQAAAEIEHDVTAAGGPPVVVQFQPLTDQRLVWLLDNTLVPVRKYHGELPEQGFFQYLMMARRYQTVAFMLMSAFGLSFVRAYRDFMLPAAIVLLSLGAIQVVHSVKRERVETLAKELEKVRELLRTESRRMVEKVEGGWLAAVKQHLGDQLQILAQVESSARDHITRTEGENDEERQRLTKQVKTADTTEKKVVALQKAREGFAQGVAQVRGELRALIAAAVRGAAA